jgi:hypothetical protein
MQMIFFPPFLYELFQKGARARGVGKNLFLETARDEKEKPSRYSSLSSSSFSTLKKRAPSSSSSFYGRTPTAGQQVVKK